MTMEPYKGYVATVVYDEAAGILFGLVHRLGEEPGNDGGTFQIQVDSNLEMQLSGKFMRAVDEVISNLETTGEDA